MAKDVVTFLSWAAEPEHDERKKLGIKAVIIFSTLFVISVYVKRFKWGPIKNRKICMCRDVFKESHAEDCFQSINLPLTLTRIPLFPSLVDVQAVWVNLLIENLDHTFEKQCGPAYVTKHSLTRAMAGSREQSQFSRKRSNTVQSNFRVPTFVPLKVGDSKILHAWVHDVRESPTVIFNCSWWPGVQEGDCFMVSSNDSGDMESGFLITLRKLEPCLKPQLQVQTTRLLNPARTEFTIDICTTSHCRCFWPSE